MYEVCFVRLTANHLFSFFPLTIPVLVAGVAHHITANLPEDTSLSRRDSVAVDK
jgi:hypothetical protein